MAAVVPGHNSGHDQDPGTVHRKSTSLDNVNLQGEQKQGQGWKSFSLQRGCVPPTEDVSAQHQEQMIAMRSKAAESQAGQGTEQEDPYGRCTNMRLTSFTDKTGASAQVSKYINTEKSYDDRIKE